MSDTDQGLELSTLSLTRCFIAGHTGYPAFKGSPVLSPTRLISVALKALCRQPAVIEKSILTGSLSQAAACHLIRNLKVPLLRAARGLRKHCGGSKSTSHVLGLHAAGFTGCQSWCFKTVQ